MFVVLYMLQIDNTRMIGKIPFSSQNYSANFLHFDTPKRFFQPLSLALAPRTPWGSQPFRNGVEIQARNTHSWSFERPFSSYLTFTFPEAAISIASIASWRFPTYEPLMVMLYSADEKLTPF
jgi:hypothetical protein